MSAAKKAVAFPCAVYVRTRGTSFLFSHMCDPGFIKEFPLSLTVSSIRDFVARRQRSMLRAPFVILVTGDTGRLVTSQGPGGPFLYTGSRYCTPLPYTQTEEVESDHIYMKFHATLATYVRGRLTDCAAIESGLMVIPRQMQAGDFSRLCRWAQRQVEKSIKDSTFLTEDASYNEQSLRAKHSPPEAQATPKKPVEKINGL